MSKHTPGPWKLVIDKIDARVMSWPNKKDIHVTLSWFDLPCEETDKETEIANARLISAAPDLLWACKAIEEVDQLVPKSNKELLVKQASMRAAIVLVKKAIKKAEGDNE